jgi:polyisoprenoid-binding protein YceI
MLAGLLLINGMMAMAQDVLYTRNGSISFFSSTPIENIEAHNKEVSSFWNTAKGELVFAVLIKSFKFQKALMQEHFNENYMESDKYPKANFKGNILNMGDVDLKKAGSYTVKVDGDLTIHGVTQHVSVPGTVTVGKDGGVSTAAKFKVKPADYGIKIPAVVAKNIAEVIEIVVNCSYAPYKK